MPQHDDENGAERADATEDVGTGSTEVIGDVSSTGPTEVIDPAASAAPAGNESTGPSASYAAAPATAPFGTWSGTHYGATSGTSTVPARPRVRVGAIVWGVLVVAFAAAVIGVSASPDARSAFDAWQASLNPVAWTIIGVVALGVAVLLIAGTSAIRGAQRRAQASDRG